jgi:hypothetical protein
MTGDSMINELEIQEIVKKVFWETYACQDG